MNKQATTQKPGGKAKRTALSIHYGLSISYGTMIGPDNGRLSYQVHVDQYDDVVVDEGDLEEMGGLDALTDYVADKAGIDPDELEDHAGYYT